MKVLDYRSKRTRSKKFAEILNAVRRKIVHPQPTLVSCFSTVRDSLEQWRGYGPSGGVSLKLGPSQEDERPLWFGPDYLPLQVLYDWRPKAVLILSIIRRFETEYCIDCSVMDGNWPENHDEEYVSYLLVLLSTKVAVFKHDSFREEAEIRIAMPYSTENLNREYEGGLRFRVSAFGLIPYVCSGARKGFSGNLPIREIVIGPSPRQELIAESVGSFLEHKGYPSIPVTLSKVPYRA
ncbi:MAG: hypothetical protein JO001_22850 [Alphaproteobacteria bacterium]|nr:hypothetical protein [Alphaproteobacteria bacterium]